MGDQPADVVMQWQSAAVAYVSPHATPRIHDRHMTKADIGKARWARARAASLWQQADTLDMDRGGDWRSRAQRSMGAARLRAEAARFDRMANRWEATPDDRVA